LHQFADGARFLEGREGLPLDVLNQLADTPYRAVAVIEEDRDAAQPPLRDLIERPEFAAQGELNRRPAAPTGHDRVPVVAVLIGGVFADDERLEQAVLED
jgi:hypothetical protein